MFWRKRPSKFASSTLNLGLYKRHDSNSNRFQNRLDSPLFFFLFSHLRRSRRKRRGSTTATTMTLLCFLIDLRSMSPALLRDLKQSLLQLANLYAVSCDTSERKRRREPFHLRDRIGLCYMQRSRTSSSSITEAYIILANLHQENMSSAPDVIMILLHRNAAVLNKLKIAYRPGERFSLRDFHYAVDSVFPEMIEGVLRGSNAEELPLESLLSNEILYSWGGVNVPKKVIVLCTSPFINTEDLRKSIMDAAERCVRVDFLILEQDEMDMGHDVTDILTRFSSTICELENCVIRSYPPGSLSYHSLAKRWLRELNNDVKEPPEAEFLFKDAIMGSVNKIRCNLFASSNPIIDGFASCQTCRCHGQPIDVALNHEGEMSCPLTYQQLPESDIIDNAVRIGEQAILFLPSFEACQQLREITKPITLNVIERTSLITLSEGLVVGKSFIVTPCLETEAVPDESDKSDLNVQIFHGLCRTLFLLDEGLVCSSNCNIETMKEGTFKCYYILQPSDRGPMLLRRLAASEEILPIPDMVQANDIYIPNDMVNNIKSFLLKIDLRDYNPVKHERGFHSKLNQLVKESLQFGSNAPYKEQTSPKVTQLCDRQHPSLTHPEGERFTNRDEEGKTATSHISEEWEQLLILDESKQGSSPAHILNIKFQTQNIPVHTKPVDDKTLKILERLEVPRQQKPKPTSPTISNTLLGGKMERPQISFDPSSSQPLKPIFQKLKRKHW